MPVKSFEPINPATDITTTRTFLHEVVPVTGSIISGTYGTYGAERNIKNYSHGMFQSVYDYPFLSSSANHIFDLTAGYASANSLSSSANVQNAKKINMYNQHAQTLLGFTGSTNNIRVFESDLILDNINAMRECFFIDFSRLLTKDEIKKNTFSITLGTASFNLPFKPGASPAANPGTLTLQDAKARINGDNVNNADGGDYGVLFSNSVGSGDGLGVVFYQAGIAVITASAFDAGVGGTIADFSKHPTHGFQSIKQTLTGSSISGTMNALRHRIQNIAFNNTTEINSTIYFCRAPSNKFNYSSNPTYVNGSKIRVKNIASDNPVAYVTTVGLYNSQNELLAVAKLSEPLKKSVDNELTIRVRLDY